MQSSQHFLCASEDFPTSPGFQRPPGLGMRPAGIRESRAQSPHCTEPQKGLGLPPLPPPWLLQPTQAEMLTWFGSHPQPDGHCQSAGQFWSSRWWHQVSGRQNLVSTNSAHWHCPPTLFPEREEQGSMPPLPRDKLQPPLSCPQACSLGGLGISPCPGAEVVVSHHCPGGQDRGWGVSRGGQAGKPGERVSETCAQGNGLKGFANQVQGSAGVTPCLYPPLKTFSLREGKLFGGHLLRARHLAPHLSLPGQWMHLLLHRGGN